MYSKILIPLDGSKTAEKVLPYARHLAGKFNTAVELLAVIDIAEMASHMAAEKARHLDTLIEDGVRSSETYLRKVANSFSGTGSQMHGREGPGRRRDHRTRHRRPRHADHDGDARPVGT